VTIREWLEVLAQMPKDLELAQLVEVVCRGCHQVAVATGFDERGEPVVPGWKRQVEDSSVRACSCECAEAVGREVVRRGGRRPHWQWDHGGDA
jgi:hypothetical protein